VALASQESGLPAAELEALVTEWMQVRPLKYLRACRARGLDAIVDWLTARQIPIGVLSDYPAADKLTAMGLADRFSPVLSATDREVGAFKPHPRGFLRAAAIWRLPPSDVLVVGDRVDADAAGAAAAGMPCVIIGRSARGRTASSAAYCVLPSLEALHHVFEHGR
jgi:HAD superfamily hydrolase (TIGR01509 family)